MTSRRAAARPDVTAPRCERYHGHRYANPSPTPPLDPVLWMRGLPGLLTFNQIIQTQDGGILAIGYSYLVNNILE